MEGLQSKALPSDKNKETSPTQSEKDLKIMFLPKVPFTGGYTLLPRRVPNNVEQIPCSNPSKVLKKHTSIIIHGDDN